MSITIKETKHETPALDLNELRDGECAVGTTINGSFKGVFLMTYEGTIYLNDPGSTWSKGGAPTITGHRCNITVEVEV